MLSGSAAVAVSESTPISRRSLQQGRPGREREVAVLVGKGDGDLGRRREGTDQVELVRGEVVEPIEEDRPAAPEGGGLGSAAGSPRGRCRSCRPSRGGRGPRRSRRRERRRRRGRPTPRGFPPLLRRRRARARRPGGRRADARRPAGSRAVPAERPSGPRARRRSAIAAEIAPRRWAGVSSAPGGAPAAVGDGVEEAAEGHHRGAEDRALLAELALEAVDVVDGRDDQHRIALQDVDQRAPDEAGAAGVGGSVDQRERHRGRAQHRSAPGAGDGVI